MIKKILMLLIFFGLVSCGENKMEEKKTDIPEKAYREQYRPQYHFSPPEKWMNDPNGLVYNDGVYHLFYQYYPEDIVWGPMHWGHATSKDLVHWQHKPIALYPDGNGLIFSGSAVVDKNNTSGFGEGDTAPLVAIFTYHSQEGAKSGRNDFQTQGIAYSLDNGDTWTKYEGNPVIGNTGIKDFRDPKVFWHEETESWIMVLVASDHAKLYRSKNLKEWSFLSDFGKDVGAHGGVWECPDLFPLKIEGTEEEKWVLIISIGRGGPNGGSDTQYFVGDFDGIAFTSNQVAYKWLDWGTDNYAGVTYNNVPNGDRIFIGWMSNWQYAVKTPTKKWRSAMTVPRTLSLRRYGDEYMLLNYPVGNIDSLAHTTEVHALSLNADGSKELTHDDLSQAQVSFTTSARDFKLDFSNDDDESVGLVFDSSSKMIMLNRKQSGIVDFDKEFGNKLHHMPIKHLPAGEVEVKILMDRSSIEVFVNNGQYVMTDQIFPLRPYTKLTLTNTSKINMEFDNFHIDKMKSVW